MFTNIVAVLVVAILVYGLFGRHPWPVVIFSVLLIGRITAVTLKVPLTHRPNLPTGCASMTGLQALMRGSWVGGGGDDATCLIT